MSNPLTTPEKSGKNSGTFASGDDPRRGRGPKKGTGGRPPDAIRQTLRLAFDQRIKVLQAFADDENLDPQVRMKAVDLLAKYGLGTTFTQTGDDGKALPVGIQVSLIRPEPGTAPQRLDAILASQANGNGHKNGNGSG